MKSKVKSLLLNKILFIAKVRYFVLFLLLLSFFSCQKNTVSDIPHIAMKNFGPPVFRISTDTLFLLFTFTDGNGDLGNDTNHKKYDIYIKDFRYDTGYVGYYFPEIDRSIEDPQKGMSGECHFEFFTPTILNMRTDSIHAKFGDTTHFEFYIMDRAGDTSNHITTSAVIMYP